jgi:hypothetical protein
MRRNRRGKSEQEPVVAPKVWDDPAHIGLSSIDDTASYEDVVDVLDEMTWFSSDIERYDVIVTDIGLVAVCQPHYGTLSKNRRAELREKIRGDMNTALVNKLHVNADITAP